MSVLIWLSPSEVLAKENMVWKKSWTLLGQASAEPPSLEAARVATLAKPYGS